MSISQGRSIVNEEWDQQLRDLALTDRHGAVWCATVVVGSLEHLVSVEASIALRLAQRWAQRDATISVAKLRQAAKELDRHPGGFGEGSPASVKAQAAHRCAVLAAAATTVAKVCSHVSLALAQARDAHELLQAGSGEPTVERLLLEQLSPLPGLSEHTTMSRRLLGEANQPGRVGTLGETLAFARQHGLRMEVPEDRWAAEHRILNAPSERPLQSGG